MQEDDSVQKLAITLDVGAGTRVASIAGCPASDVEQQPITLPSINTGKQHLPEVLRAQKQVLSAAGMAAKKWRQGALHIMHSL